MKKRIDATGREVGRTEGAKAAYRLEAKGMSRRIKREIGYDPTPEESVDWFLARHEAYRPSTIRKYRAALRQVLEDGVGLRRMDEALANELDRRLAAGPRPTVSGKKRTSARKAKAITAKELSALMATLHASNHPFDGFLMLWTYFSVRFFTRPVEWSRAVVVEDDLIVANAKTTNGRAHGPYRIFVIDGLTSAQLADLDTFLGAITKLVDHFGSYARLQKSLARRLTTVCRHASIRALCPTSLRHTGMAAAKAQSSVETVAYMAGHRSIATAGHNYAKARSAIPDLPMIAKVRQADVDAAPLTGKAFRPSSAPGVRLAR